MKMLKCRGCNCNCDLSDLINGLCDDCRYKRDRKIELNAESKKFDKAEFIQLRLEGI